MQVFDQLAYNEVLTSQLFADPLRKKEVLRIVLQEL